MAKDRHSVTHQVEKNGISRKGAVTRHQSDKGNGNTNRHEEDGNMGSNRIGWVDIHKFMDFKFHPNSSSQNSTAKNLQEKP